MTECLSSSPTTTGQIDSFMMRDSIATAGEVIASAYVQQKCLSPVKEEVNNSMGQLIVSAKSPIMEKKKKPSALKKKNGQSIKSNSPNSLTVPKRPSVFRGNSAPIEELTNDIELLKMEEKSGQKKSGGKHNRNVSFSDWKGMNLCKVKVFDHRLEPSNISTGVSSRSEENIDDLDLLDFSSPWPVSNMNKNEKDSSKLSSPSNSRGSLSVHYRNFSALVEESILECCVNNQNLGLRSLEVLNQYYCSPYVKNGKSEDLCYYHPMFKGIVAVKNLEFNKSVEIRYTTDSWRTFKKSTGRFCGSFGGFDNFSFILDVSCQVSKANTLEFCIDYCALGKHFWDNNGGQNFCVDISYELANKSSARVVEKTYSLDTGTNSLRPSPVSLSFLSEKKFSFTEKNMNDIRIDDYTFHPDFV
eukprot:Nk52_evm109s221 gene=Nk52_evmTU109s221